MILSEDDNLTLTDMLAYKYYQVYFMIHLYWYQGNLFY